MLVTYDNLSPSFLSLIFHESHLLENSILIVGLTYEQWDFTDTNVTNSDLS